MDLRRRPDLFVVVTSLLAAGCVSDPLTPDGARGPTVVPCAPAPCPSAAHWDATICRCVVTPSRDAAAPIDACLPLPCPSAATWDPSTCRCVPPPPRDAAAGACAPIPCPPASAGWDPVTCECGPPPPRDAAADAGECRGPGRYEAGKEGSYRPCCDGLTEVGYASAAYTGADVRICWMPPLRVYACVKGSCGDGICEVGEAAPCGCVADCPSARWETPDASPAQ
jgi:hypothetical protein